MEIIFWVSFIFLFYIYIGYPLTLFVLNNFISKPVQKENLSNTVSIVISVYNEEKNIENKITNLLNQNCSNLKEILIGSDGSTDSTNSILTELNNKNPQIRPFIFTERAGKPTVLAKLVSEAFGEIIVFTDARQILKENALNEIISNFADKSIGCVSGELMFYKDDFKLAGEGIGLYWQYEKAIRRLESNIYSMIGATGAFYSIRKELFSPPKANTILDDVYIPLKIVLSGHRALFDSKAIAYDKISPKSSDEFKKKTRTLAGNYQLFFENTEFLNPLKNPIFIQCLSHKLLRAFAFVFLISLLITNVFLCNNNFYTGFFILQIIFYFSAYIGYLCEKKNLKIPLISFSYMFCVLNIASLIGFVKYLNGTQKVTWKLE